MGLVELLIALSIIAALLTAVAVATDAAFHGYAVNQEQSALTQRARVALHRLLLQVRTSEAHAADPDPDSVANERLRGGLIVFDHHGIALFDNVNTLFHYRWDPMTQQVLVDEQPEGAPGPVTYVLLRGVTDFRVTLEPLPGTRGKLRRATVQLTLEVTGADDEAGDGGAKARITFSSSAVPRRNVW